MTTNPTPFPTLTAPDQRHAQAPTALDPDRLHEPLLRDWLAGSQEALFRWVMAMAVGDDGRRAVAEVAVAVRRLRGDADYAQWLYGTAVQAASLQAGQAAGMEPTLAGLPPELRALLRLVAQQALRREDAMALLAQRMGNVRRRMLRARLDSAHGPTAQRADAHGHDVD